MNKNLNVHEKRLVTFPSSWWCGSKINHLYCIVIVKSYFGIHVTINIVIMVAVGSMYEWIGS